MRRRATSSAVQAALERLVDEWTVGQVPDLAFVSEVARGIDVVVSALGITRQEADLFCIDRLVVGTHRLLDFFTELVAQER